MKARALDGKNYGLYKSLAERSWDFGDFVLDFLHVQGDPYAPASRLLVRAKLSDLGYASEWGSDFERRLALSDFLHRRLSHLVQQKYPGKDASVVFDVAGPEMLVRNSLWIDNGEIRACLQVRLPGEGRKIQAEDAAIAKVAEKNVGKNKKAKKISKAEKVEDPTDAIVEAIEQEDVG